MPHEIVPDSEHAGLVARTSDRLRPFILLARLDRPIGWQLLFWPCAWGVALAGGVISHFALILWMLLGLHTVHLVTDVVDTFVAMALMFTRHGFGKRFSDIDDNAFYWAFVVLSWLPIYVLLYWGPRL